MDLRTIVIVFIAAVVGTVLVGALADTNSIIINDIDILNETILVNVTGFQNASSVNTSMPFTLTNDDWVVNSVDVYNTTTGVLLTAGTDYFVDYTAETINFSNNTFTIFTASNESLVNYSYYHDNYLNDAPSRTMVSLLLLLFVVGLLLVIVDAVTKGSIIGIFKKK